MGGVAGEKALSTIFSAGTDKNWLVDVGGARNAASNASTALSQQKTDAAALSQQLLTQPKTITPDNFLADKAKQLAGLKLGLAGTITGGGMSGVLGSTSLTGNAPGKQKLGQ